MSVLFTRENVFSGIKSLQKQGVEVMSVVWNNQPIFSSWFWMSPTPFMWEDLLVPWSHNFIPLFFFWIMDVYLS